MYKSVPFTLRRKDWFPRKARPWLSIYYRVNYPHLQESLKIWSSLPCRLSLSLGSLPNEESSLCRKHQEGVRNTKVKQVWCPLSWIRRFSSLLGSGNTCTFSGYGGPGAPRRHGRNPSSCMASIQAEDTWVCMWPVHTWGLVPSSLQTVA